jgi:cyclophilin family peptidyl-prolyl cis-trans isomerase
LELRRFRFAVHTRPEDPMAPKQYPAPPDMTIDLDKAYSATLHTNHGDITIDFFADESPLTVNNFVSLARDGFYDGVIFHRVVPGFVVQGGDPTGTGTGGPGYRFRDELEKRRPYSRGTVAMANAGPNTNGSQFFICLDDVGLPHSYTIFGTVSDGMDAVDAIAAVPRSAERPKEDCVIERVTITEE